MSEKLNSAEKRDLVIQAGIQLIPYIGGPMSSLYFGAKQEKRFKRLETFYQELAEEVEKIKTSVKPVDHHDPEALEAILESLHDKVEAEPTCEKREFFKNYFKNTLKKPVAGNYDERKFFLESLADMSLLECEILAFVLSKPQQIKVGSISKPNVDQYAIVGVIGRLKSRGFLTAAQGSFAIGTGSDNSLQELVSVSSYGRSFSEFCLSA